MLEIFQSVFMYIASQVQNKLNGRRFQRSEKKMNVFGAVTLNRFNLDIGKFSFSNRVCDCWNHLPNDIVTSSVPQCFIT